MRTRIYSPKATRAFTLLELLLAMAIGAVVLLVINGTFFGALRLYKTTHDKIDVDLALQRTLGIVRRDLAGIMIPASPTATTNNFAGQLQSDATSTSALDDTAQRITPDIHTNSGHIDGWAPFAEVQTVTYYLTSASDGGSTKNLVRATNRNLLSASTETTIDAQVLLTGISTAAISFYDGQSWVETWDSTSTSSLPNALKFSLVLAPRGGENRADPAPIELIVPVIVKTTTTAQQEATAATL
jgi:hypothetical protein